MATTVIYTTSTIDEKAKLLNAIEQILKKEPYTRIFFERKTSCINVYHSAPIPVLIRQYIVVVIPVQINLHALDSFTGHVIYHFDDTIESLERLTTLLKSKQGPHLIKGASFEQTSERLAEILHGVDAEY